MHPVFAKWNTRHRFVTLFEMHKLIVRQTPENNRVCIQKGTEDCILLTTEEWNMLARPELQAPTHAEWQKFWASSALTPTKKKSTVSPK